MNNYQRALSGYSNSAGEINGKLGGYRGDIDNVKAKNKAGLAAATSSAQEQVDLNALTGVGEEFAIRGAKAYGKKTLGYAYKRSGLKEIDQKAGKFIKGKFQKATGTGGADADEVAESGEGIELGDKPSTASGGGTGEPPTSGPDAPRASAPDAAPEPEDTQLLGDDPYAGFQDFQNFMKDNVKFPHTPMTEGGDIDFDRPGFTEPTATPSAPPDVPTSQVATRNTAASSEADATAGAEGDLGTGGGGMGNGGALTDADAIAARDAGSDAAGIARNAASDAAQTATNAASDAAQAARDAASQASSALTGAGDAAKQAASDAADAAAQAAKDVAEKAAAAAGDALANAGASGLKDAAASGLEALGAGLDSTGVLAPLGVLAQIAGGVLEAGGIYQMGEGLVNWWDTAVMGDKPKVNFKATKAPVVPQTIASRGLMAMPTMDSNMDIPSTGGSW